MKIIPAILENELDLVKNKIEYFSNLKNKYSLDFDLVQIDFCDGQFVENKNWLPENIQDLNQLVNIAKNFKLETHIMCKDIEKYFNLCKDSGIKNIIIHIDDFLLSDTEYLLRILEDSVENTINLGLCTKLSFMKQNKDSVLSFIGSNKNKFINSSIYLQIMGIENIGRQGEPFSEDSINLIQEVRELFTNEELSINIDGSVNQNTYKILENAGANSLVVGSYFIKTNSEEEFVERFNLLKS